MALTNDQITAKNFQKFYNLILPYLNGAPGCTPIGTIIAVMGNSAPAYYLKCDGTIYNIADYPDLANYFEVQFDGEINKFGGDGTTTFAVPDLRGEFLRGNGTNSHTWTDKYGNVATEGSGAEVGEHQGATQHTGIWANDTRTIVANGITGAMPSSDSYTSIEKKATRVSTNSSANNNLSIFYTSRPTSTSVLYCIAYKNIYAESSGGGGSDVTVTPIITSGEKIATIGVDGVNNDLYAPLPKEYDSGDGIDITNDTISVDEMSSEDMSEIISPLPSAMSRRMKYSTEEQIVGEWVDGKPLYRKCIPYGPVQSVSGTISQIDLPYPNNIENAVGFSGYFMTGTSYNSIPFSYSTNWFARIVYSPSTNKLTIDYLVQASVSIQGVAIIEYTKTTD